MLKIEAIDRNEAIRYLAGNSGQEISFTAQSYMDECEKRLLAAIDPKFTYRYFPLTFSDGKPSVQGCRLPLEGDGIAAHLENCSGLVLMCATLGSGADRLIRLLQIEDMAKAVITDAFASAAIEQVCGEAEEHIRNELSGKYFTWRFSPGYDDFPLSIQKQLLEVLDAPRKTGLCVSESMSLTPVKSVTALMGVSDEPLPQKKRGCITCGMRERCQFRKRGSHCGF